MRLHALQRVVNEGSLLPAIFFCTGYLLPHLPPESIYAFDESDSYLGELTDIVSSKRECSKESQLSLNLMYSLLKTLCSVVDYSDWFEKGKAHREMEDFGVFRDILGNVTKGGVATTEIILLAAMKVQSRRESDDEEYSGVYREVEPLLSRADLLAWRHLYQEYKNVVGALSYNASLPTRRGLDISVGLVRLVHSTI